MTFAKATLERAAAVLERAGAAGLKLACAESCTGGLIISCLTEIAGSSAVVERGFVTYDDAAKREVLGVPDDLLRQVGAVSEEVARAMAEGVLARAPVDLAVASTWRSPVAARRPDTGARFSRATGAPSVSPRSTPLSRWSSRRALGIECALTYSAGMNRRGTRPP
jgi:hypothetical protein